MTSEKMNQLKIKKFVVGFLATNCYLAYDDNAKEGIIIDPGANDEDISRFIEDNALEIKFILNTHGHADHIAGNVPFGYPVYIHEKDEDCLFDSTKSLSNLLATEMPKPKEIHTIKDGDVLKVGEFDLEVIHTPGHSPGGVSVKCENVLFSGDTLFNDGVGRTDLPGGDYATLEKSIREKLYSLPENTRVLPGHGPETTIGYEKKNNPFIR